MKQILEIPRTAMEVFNMLPEGTRCEVIDNTLYMSPSPTSDHQDILGEIFFNIKQQTHHTQAGKVYVSPLDVYLDDESNIVQPDIVFISAANLNRVQRKGIMGSPDLVIEILSTNRSYDMNEKFALYQRNKVPEYVIIDPETKQVLQYILIGDQYEAIPSANGILNLKALNTQLTF